MLLPEEISPNLKFYANFESEKECLEALYKSPVDLFSFFVAACADESWVDSHTVSMKGLFQWITDAQVQRNFPQELFKSLIPTIQLNHQRLKPFIPLDLVLKMDTMDYPINSLLLSQQSFYFRRRIINESNLDQNRVLIIDEIPEGFIGYIDEFILSGSVKDLWKFPPDELWEIINCLSPLGFTALIEASEQVLRRYIDRQNVLEMLLKAHINHLQILQDACIEFLNQLEMGVRLNITSVEYLSLEFLNFRSPAFEVFDAIVHEITHLTFSHQLPADPNFKSVIHRCPHLICLDFTDSTHPPDDFYDIPNQMTEIRLSHCQWVDSGMLHAISKNLPSITILDLSSNDQLTYSVLSELSKFKKLGVLNISRCFQLGDVELKILLQACPKLYELQLSDCHKISPDGFFEIGKSLTDLSILNISRTSISDASLIDLMMRCRSLYILDISRCPGISEKGVMEGIRSCPSLRKMIVRNSGITNHEMDQIKKHFPYVKVLA